MADPALANQEAPQEEPAQPAPEAVETPPASQESLGEAEARLESMGREKLNAMGKDLNLQAEHGAQEFQEETKSFWSRTKERLFGRKDEAPVKGEAEIMAEIEKSNAAYAEFRKKYDEIMSSGDAEGLRGLERDLSQTFDVLAPKVAAEGAADAKAMKEALKTGAMPEMSRTGAMLNDVSRRLQEVRGRLGGAPAPNVEAPAAEATASETAPQAQESAPSGAQAETEGDAEAPAAEQVKDEESQAARTQEILDGASPAEREELERLLYGGKVQVGKGFFSKQDMGREGLFANEKKGRKGFFAREGTGMVKKGLLGKKAKVGGIADTPAEAMLGAYLDAKRSVGTKDENGEVIGASLDAQTGEVRTKYADGTMIHRYPDGRVLRSMKGGKMAEMPAPSAPTQESQPQAADLGAPATPETAPPTGAPETEAQPEAEAELDAEQLAEMQAQARSRAENFLQALDPGFSVKTHEIMKVGATVETVPALKIVHPGIREMNATLSLGQDPKTVEAQLEPALQGIYDRGVEQLGMRPEQLKKFESMRIAAEKLLTDLDPKLKLTIGNGTIHFGDGSAKRPYETPALSITHPDEELLNWSVEVDVDEPGVEERLLAALKAQYVRKTESADEEREKLSKIRPGDVLHEVVSDSGQKRAAKEEGEETEAPDEDAEIFNDAEKAQLAAGAEDLKKQAGVVSGETEAKEPQPMPPEEPKVIVDMPVVTKTSEQSPTASGEIGGEPEKPAEPPKRPTPREVYPDLPEPEPGSRPPGVPTPEAPAEVHEVEDAQIESAEPTGTESVAAPETAPAPKEAPALSPEEARKNPLDARAMPTVVAAMGSKKFNTPGSLRDAMDAAGFAFPGDMESDELKKLHDAYKKATRKKS